LLGIGDWGLGIGDWGLGPIPNPQYFYHLLKNKKFINNNIIILYTINNFLYEIKF